MRVIDAENHVLGRLATHVASAVLDGDEIRVVNAEKAVVSGDRDKTIETYRAKRTRGSKEFGPYFPRDPANIVKRTVRGMLPYKKKRGRDALQRLKVFKNLPAEFEDATLETVDDAAADNLKMRNYTTLQEISQHL